MSDVVLNIGGTKYAGWVSLDATISMENLSGQFEATITDTSSMDNKPIRALPTIRPGLTCEVYVNDQIVITGYVDTVTPSIDAESHSITVKGRDKTGDLVDCSMIEGSGQWKGLTIQQIIKRICDPFSIPVTLEASEGAAFNNFLVEQGSTCFETIQKLCYMRQLLALSDGRGGLKLTKSSTEKLATDLIEGVNIKSGEAEYDFSDRFSVYICKGQRQGDDTTTPVTVASNVGQVTDRVITRYRPLLILAEGQADIDTCRKRAGWEAAIRKGKSQRYTITHTGWSQQNGNIWEINKLIYLRSVLLGVDGTFLISEVNFKLDESGEIAVLKLTQPEAFTLDGRQSPDKGKTSPYIQVPATTA